MTLTVTVVAGNPKPGSRTLGAARLLGAHFSDDVTAIDVITLGPGLLGWGDENVRSAVDQVRGSDLVIVASPTFKATYSGVLKLFLDQFDTFTGLAGVTAIPMMLGGGPAHQMAPEVFLKPLLVELGATVPAQGLYLIDRTYDQPGVLDGWLDRWETAVRAAASHQIIRGG
jgi:FMN reductase